MTKARASLWYLCCLESINLTYVLGHIVITLKGCTKPVEAGEVGISECGKVDQSLAIMPGMHWIPEPHVGAVTMKSIVLISQAGSLFISCNRLNIMISVLPTYWRVSSCSSYNSLRVQRGIIASCNLVYTGSCPLSFNHHIMATNPDMIEKLVWEADGCSLYPDPPTSKWSSIELAGHVGTFLALPGVHQHHHHHSLSLSSLLHHAMLWQAAEGSSADASSPGEGWTGWQFSCSHTVIQVTGKVTYQIQWCKVKWRLARCVGMGGK